MAVDLTKTAVKTYSVTWTPPGSGPLDMGLMKIGAKWGMEGQMVEITDSDQFTGIAASQQRGWMPTLSMVLYEVDTDTLAGKILYGAVNTVTSSGSVAYDFDTVPVDNFIERAGELVLHPTDNADDNLADDLVFWLAFPKPKIELVSDRTKYQEVPVDWTIFPDTTRARSGYSYSATYARIGSKNISAAAPTYVGIVLGNRAVAPYKHVPAVSLDSDDSKKAEAYGAWVTTTGGITIVENEAGNVNTTVKTMAYDAKSTASYSLTGKYITNGTEVCYVSADTQATSTTGTVTFARAAAFTTAATHADDQVWTEVTALIVYRVTNGATWASSSTGDFTAGDTASTKGVYTWVSVGSGNLTATYMSVASKACVVTTTA